MKTILILLLSLAGTMNFSGGCTKVVNISMGEAKQRPTQRVRTVEIPVAIVAVKRSSGEVIPFREPTGYYLRNRRQFVGLDTAGDSVAVALQNVAWALVARHLWRGYQNTIKARETPR